MRIALLPFCEGTGHSSTTLSFSGCSPTRQLPEGRSLSELLMAAAVLSRLRKDVNTEVEFLSQNLSGTP